MPRIYYPVSEIKDNSVSITGEKARYLISVVRCKKGDELNIFDGKGTCLMSRIEKVGKKEVFVKVIKAIPGDTESPLHVVLLQGLLKGEKMDLVIQRTTELGVKEIIPVLSERSQLRETRKVDRWRKIAEEASRQSGRNVIPVIHEPIDFSTMVSSNNSQERMYGLIFYEEGGMSLSHAMQQKSIHNESSPIQIFIGPEGGFTREEINLAKERGLLVVSLGKRILRAETAAISAVTLVQFFLGDMS